MLWTICVLFAGLSTVKWMLMCCLQVVPAEYAFVLHTANPITGAKGEVFGELVQGMGEALVGNHPGRALSFKAGTDGVEVG